MDRKFAVTFLISASAALLGVAVPLAYLNAADYLPKGPRHSGNVVVGGEQTFRNLYVAGGTVVVNKQVLGDLFAAGGSVVVAAPVEKDLAAAGSNVSVGSSVGEDARLAGGNVVVDAPIGGDALLMGGTVSLTGGARIGGDLWAAGGIVNVTGPIARDAKIAGGEIYINAPVGGALEVWADRKLVFGPEARVPGAIRYSGPREAVVEEGARIGPVTFTRVDREKYVPLIAGFGAFFFLKLIALFVAGVVLLKLFRGRSLAVVSASLGNFWQNLGIGFLGIVAIPVAAALLMSTVVGSLLGVILAVCFVYLALLSGVFAVILIGSLVEKWLARKQALELTWMTVLWGVVVGGALTLIPVIGWLAVCVAYLVTFGGMLRTVKRKMEAGASGEV